MKIILAVADYKGKNVVIVSDDFQVYSLELMSYKATHDDPHSNPRSEQIVGEFYSLAKKWLS